MTVTFALLSAFLYGTSDFIGGFLSTRFSVWKVAFATQLGGSVAMAALALLTSGEPTAVDLAWGVVAGLGTAVGVVTLYLGLAVGRMGVVAPLSGLTGAVVPAAVGILTGDRPSALAWLGLLAALPAVMMVAATPRTETEVGRGSGALYGLVAGVGFGVGFAAIAQVSPDAGNWPISLEMIVGALATALAAQVAREAWWPRTASEWWPAPSGVLGAAALVLFVAATTHGMLAVAAVIASLYPAATVAWAVVLLHERIHRTQAIGLGLCASAVILVAVG